MIVPPAEGMRVRACYSTALGGRGQRTAAVLAESDQNPFAAEAWTEQVELALFRPGR
jgi:hypothetical protein